MAGAYRTGHSGRLCRECRSAWFRPFRGRVDHVGVAVFFDDRAVLHVGAEGQVNRFRVGRKAIGRDLADDRILAANW